MKTNKLVLVTALVGVLGSGGVAFAKGSAHRAPKAPAKRSAPVKPQPIAPKIQK